MYLLWKRCNIIAWWLLRDSIWMILCLIYFINFSKLTCGNNQKYTCAQVYFPSMIFFMTWLFGLLFNHPYTWYMHFKLKECCKHERCMMILQAIFCQPSNISATKPKYWHSSKKVGSGMVPHVPRLEHFLPPFFYCLLYFTMIIIHTTSTNATSFFLKNWNGILKISFECILHSSCMN